MVTLARKMEQLPAPKVTTKRLVVTLAVVAAAFGALLLATTILPPGNSGSIAKRPDPAPVKVRTFDHPRIFAYYYLWWSRKHWLDRLGPEFPFTASPLPLPAELAPDGCSPRTLFKGNSLTDVPSSIYGQDDEGVIEGHVRSAASAGLKGFIVNWRGTGTPQQKPTDGAYNPRLERMFQVVERLNREGIDFKLWLNYRASAQTVPLSEFEADLRYLVERYVDHPALDRTFSSRPILIWSGSRKYPVETLEAVSAKFRSDLLILGDENRKSWDAKRAEHMDGVQYYWSSQNPYRNPASQRQLVDLAAAIRATAHPPQHKLWIAPITPGFNAQLLTGSTNCVPRNDGETLRKLFEMNSASRPDAWALISWNEIAEGTYVEPLQRWGDRYLEVISELSLRSS